MTRHVIRRLIQAIPTVFGVTLISYMIIAFAPGDVTRMLAMQGDPQKTSAEVQERRLEQLGLNDPWPVQYLVWLTGNDWLHNLGMKDLDIDDDGEIDANLVRYGIFRGDFGQSFKYKEDALTLILDRIPATLELGIAALMVGMFLGVPLGILAAIWRGSPFDNFTRILAVVGNAIPNFWFGFLLLMFFGVALDLEWARGNRCDYDNSRQYQREYGTFCPPLHMRVEYMILPTIVLAYGGIAGYSRYMRTSMLDTVNSDYVRTARAKGLRSRTVWFRHAARNALIPLATFLGPAVVGVLGGAAITEAIFTWPGLGRLLLEAVSGRDYPIVMASVLISSILTIFAYIISDIAYAVFDPRIRF